MQTQLEGQFSMAGKFRDTQSDFPLNECEFVFENRTVRLAYQGSCTEALDQYFKAGRCTEDEVANVLTIKEKNLRKTG
jgi:hypothetical protein